MIVESPSYLALLPRLLCSKRAGDPVEIRLKKKAPSKKPAGAATFGCRDLPLPGVVSTYPPGAFFALFVRFLKARGIRRVATAQASVAPVLDSSWTAAFWQHPCSSRSHSEAMKGGIALQGSTQPSRARLVPQWLSAPAIRPLRRAVAPAPSTLAAGSAYGSHILGEPWAFAQSPRFHSAFWRPAS